MAFSVWPGGRWFSAGVLAIAGCIVSDAAFAAHQCPKGYIGGPKGCVRGVPTVTPAKPASRPKPADTSHVGTTRQKMSISHEPNVPKEKVQKKSQPQTTQDKPPKVVTPKGPQPQGGSAQSNNPNIPDPKAPAKDTAKTPSNKGLAGSDTVNVPDSKTGGKVATPGKTNNSPTQKSTGSDTPNTPEPSGGATNANDDRPRPGKTRPDTQANDRQDDDAKPRGKPAQSQASRDSDDETPRAKKASPQRQDAATGSSAPKPAAAARDTPAPPARVATTGALATTATGGAAFAHNNSRMSVAEAGNTVSIAYDKPRDGLADLGIKPGTPLFTGTKSGSRISGEATTFSRRCGTRTYPVSGEQTADGRRYELRGKKPSFDGDCNVAGYKDEVLVFETAGDTSR